ncbi:RNA-directed DNA polymerase from mobile element jockey-like protein [Pitangus sulphuratus]|nr:RNA-directed DNA polymerase from mobile element jockey-like protein [Pitangus sulphuratus]
MSLQNLSMIFECSWEYREVLADWKMVNIVPIFKKGKKEDPGDDRPVSLTLVSGKVKEIILRDIESHLKDNEVIGHSQYNFVRGKFFLSNLISFYDKVIHLADQEKPVDVIFLNFSKAFNIISHRILLDKMSSTQLDKHIMWHVFTLGGVLDGTGISADDALAELATETFVILEEASSPNEDGKNKGKKEISGPVFFFHVMIMLSLLEQNDTLTL